MPGPFVCDECREPKSFDPEDEEYRCPHGHDVSSSDGGGSV